MIPYREYRRTTLAAVAILFLFWNGAPDTLADLVSNGGFESGFAGWTRLDAVGSDGTFFLQSGAASPVNGDTVPAPPGGSRAAMMDAQGPGSHLLYQDIVVPPSPGPAELRFDLFMGNRAASFFTPDPASLDFSTPALNQQARVDILLVGSDPFSVSAADVLLSVYQTKAGDPLVSGYTAVVADITALLAANAGNTLRLRFAEVDNLFTLQVGVDNVAIVPEQSVALLALLGAGGVALRRRRIH